MFERDKNELCDLGIPLGDRAGVSTFDPPGLPHQPATPTPCPTSELTAEWPPSSRWPSSSGSHRNPITRDAGRP